MNIQQLRYVVATAEHGSMTAAAAALFVAQPALSRAVRLLEREVGVTLFARSGRGVVLTSAGEAFVSRARKVLRSLDSLRGVAEDREAPTLVIAASPTMQASVAIPILAALRDHGFAGHTRLVGCGGATEVHGLVASGRADVGLCDQEVASELTVVPLGRTEVRLYSPPGLDLPDPIAMADMAGVPLVLPTVGNDRRVALDRFFEVCGIVPLVAIESDERGVWLEALLQGLASCVWHSVEALVGPAGRVVARSFDPPFHQELSAVHDADNTGTAKELLVELLGQFAELARPSDIGIRTPRSEATSSARS